MTKTILLIILIFLGLAAAIQGRMFLASVCGLVVFTICILYALKSVIDAREEVYRQHSHDIAESFWHEEINQN